MATSIQVDKFATPHGKGEGGGGGTTIVMGGKNNSVPANLNVNTINATTGNIQNLTGRSMSFNDASFIYLVSENGTIAKLNGNDLKYENGSIKSITSDSIETGKLKTTDLEATNATIDNIISKNITTENLTVTKQAHFFELVIDKIKSVGGQIILTPASCIADYVIPDPDHVTPLYYDVYFRATDEVGREITNGWQKDDQAICQNFNNATQGHNYNVSNKYYWRLVTDTLDDAYINFRTGQKLPYNTTDAHNYTSANIWNICLGANDVNTGNHIDYKTEFGSEPGGDPYYPADPDTEGYTKRSLLDNIDITPMELNGLPMAGWTDKTEPEDENEVPMVGEMKTYNTIFGIQITPKEGYQLDGALLNNIELSTAEETRLNIGIYYVDGSSQYFPAPLEKTRHYVYELNANTNMEAIIITNSDEPDWHLCHGIQLGNDNSNANDLQVDVEYNPYGPTPSIPEAGDNIIQLGYRYHKYDAESSDPDEAAKHDEARASAIIIASYHTPDAQIVPPSYAQYQKINDFRLADHRGTYMDATGTFIKGSLVTTSGNVIDITDDGLDISTSYYRLICNENPITKPATSKTVRFTVFSVEDGIGTEMTAAQLNGWTLKIGSSTLNPVQNQNYFEVTINSTDTSIEAKLYDNSTPTPLLKDTYVGSIINLEDVNDGLPGDFTEWIYKNGVTAGSLPTNGTDIDNLDNDWSKTATTPDFANDEFTWCSYRNNTWIRTANDPAVVYGNWQTAYRITGNNGQPGEDGDPGTAGKDGKYIEYIYIHTTVETSFTYQNNPNNWDSNSSTDKRGNTFDDPDYLGPENAGWDDHPQGLGTIDNVFYEFEYMSQREFDGEHFGTFTEPVIWSRWGQDGKDGDGYEYIYRLSDTEPTDPNNISRGEVGPQGVANGSNTNKNQDEWVPNGWTDDPQGVSSTPGEQKEWVSMRKKSDGDWYEFSYPALWAQYVPKGAQGAQGSQGYNGRDGIDGAQGAQGSQGSSGRNGRDGIDGAQGSQGYNGRDGNNGEYFALVPVREVFEVRLNGDNVGTTAYTNIRGDLYMDLIYAVAHVNGNNVTYLNASEMQQYGLNIISDNTSGQNTYYFRYSNTGDRYRYQSVSIINNTTGATVKSYDAIRIEIPNYLTWINNSGNTYYNNYYYLHDNNLTSWMPTRLTVRLFKNSNNAEMDATNVDLSFRPGHIFSVTDSALNSIYQGLSGSTGEWSTSGFSNIKQSWDKIGLTVSNNTNLYTPGKTINKSDNVYGNALTQYAFYRSATNYTTDKGINLDPPSGDVTRTTNVNNAWTLDTTMEPAFSYKYMYISYREHSWNTATGQFNGWGLWSKPQLYWVYNVPKSSINSAQLNIEADKIESKVTKNIRGGGVNLIMNGNFSKLSSGSPEYWDAYQNPPYRYINTDNTDHNWMYVQSNDSYQGYAQKHYNDKYNIRIDGGQTYTLSFRAYSPTTAYVSITFHFWNDTTNWSLYASNEYPQFAKHFKIDNKDTIYSYTFVANQGNYAHSGNNLYVKNNRGTYIDTGKPAQGFEFIIGSGVDEQGNPISSQAFYITDVMLAPGTMIQSWQPSLQETEAQTQSLISQEADSIRLEVQSDIDDVNNNIDGVESNIKNGLRTTGINIDTHNITLNADKTTINGQLEVNSNTNGIKVSAITYDGGSSVTTYGYLTGGPIDSFSNWGDKACNSSNAISRLGANGYEYISPWSNSGRKIYIGEEGIRLDSLNTAIQLSEYHLNKYVKDANFTYSTGYKYKPIDYKGIRVFYVNSNGIYLNNQYGTQLANYKREYTLSQYDEMIIIHGDNSCILSLPSPSYDWTGKTITIRNNSKRAIRLDSSMGFYTTCWSDNSVSYDNDSNDDYGSCAHMYVRAYGCTQLVYNYTYSNAMTGWHEITNGWHNTYRSDTARTVTQMDNNNNKGW